MKLIPVSGKDYRVFFEKLVLAFQEKENPNDTSEWHVRGLWKCPGEIPSKDPDKPSYRSVELFKGHNATSHEYFWVQYDKYARTPPYQDFYINAQAFKKALIYLEYRLSEEVEKSGNIVEQAKYLWEEFINSEPNEKQSHNILDYIPEFSDLLLGPFNILPKNFEINVHKELVQFDGIDEFIGSHFSEINLRREKQYTSSLKYRLIGYGRQGSKVIVHVAPANFAHLVVYNECKQIEEVQQYFAGKMQEQTEQIKQNTNTDDQLNFVDHYFVIVGMECCLITRDNYCFIRRRGRHTHLAPGKWSTGLNGYIGNGRMFASGKIDIVDSLSEEIRHKISDNISASTMEIVITGLHRNTDTNATDILCYWRLDMTATQLIKQIGSIDAEINKVFLTTNMPNNSFLRDSSNFLFPIELEEAKKLFAVNNIQANQIEPECLKSIQLALKSALSL